MLKPITFLVLAALLGATACNEGACISGVGAPGIVLGTRDSVTGAILDQTAIVTVVRLQPTLAPLQPDSARGSIRVDPLSTNPLDLADIPGRYRVTVEASGYRTWTREVTVELGCGRVNTVEIIARLQPG